MNDFIAEANSIYCTNQHETEIRRDIIQKAIGCNEAIIQRLRRCAMELEGIDVNKFDKVGELLIKESTLLRNWKQSTKCAR